MDLGDDYDYDEMEEDLPFEEEEVLATDETETAQENE